MAAGLEMPLQQVLQALSRTPAEQRQLRGVLAFTCARWALERDEEGESVRLLAQALDMVPDLRPAMRVLYRINAQKQDVRGAVMYLDQEIRATRHPREAAALYRERGQLVEEHFRDYAAARQCYEAALKATPDDLAVLRSVERVALARGDIFALIENLESQLDVLREPGAIAAVLRDLSLLETRHGGDLALAGDMLLDALEQQPGHLGLIGDLFRVAEISRDSELMLHSLDMEATARPPSERSMPLARASLVLREHRERGPAVALLHAAALAQPKNLSLWRSLEELSMATGRYDAALEACLRQVQALGDQDDQARAELFFRAGRLALSRLSRPGEGLAAMRKALRLCPSHLPALEEAARYLIAHEGWAQLLELLRLQSRHAQQAGLTRAETAQALLRAGQLLEERLDQPESARRRYEEAINIAPSFRPARDRLERLLHQTHDLAGLAAFYKDELDRATNLERRLFLLSVLGQLHASDTDPALAIKYLVTLLKETPEHVSSLQLLARLLSRAGRTREVLRVTDQEVRLTLSPSRRAKLSHRSGELAEQLGELDRAKTYYEAALEAVDDHQPSVVSLERLVRMERDPPALLEVLRKRLLYANDRERQVALRLEISSILANDLQRPEEALRELEQILDRWPRHLPALHAAEGLATRLERWSQLLDLLDQHVATVQGPRTRALLLHRAANIRSRKLGDHEGAIRNLVRALELWPQLGVARALLLSLYERLGRSRELQSFAEAGLTSERGADDRRAMALQLAELTPRPVVALQYLGAVAEARPEDFVTQLRLARAARAARRPSREAGALTAASAAFGDQVPADDPHQLALCYRAARAEETAGNLDRADDGYARVLDVDPSHALARKGRRRVKLRKEELATSRKAEDLSAAEAAAKHAAEQAAFATIAAEVQERRGQLALAVEHTAEALEHCPQYLPALHARARILERMGGEQNAQSAIECFERLAELLHDAPHRERALCSAGTIALRIGSPAQPNPDAWRLFGRALDLNPQGDRPLRGLMRALATHGPDGAPTLVDAMRRRLAAEVAADELDPHRLRTMVRIVSAADGPEAAVSVLEEGLTHIGTSRSLRAELAQLYARLGRYDDVVRELEAALAEESSPERQAALEYFLADAHERAGNLVRAAGHYINAGRGGFHPRHALLSADRIAAEIGAIDQRVAALQLLVDIGDGSQRVRGLRALADLHRGPLGKPDVAVELMQELLLLRPTDVDVIAELNRLLIKLERGGEANATLLAGVAQHRAWLRAQGVFDPAADRLDPRPAIGLSRLFDLLGEADGVYLGAALIEVVAPDHVLPGRGCDELVSDPWPLPDSRDRSPFDYLVGDLPCSAAIDLLHEATFYLPELPDTPPPSIKISGPPLPPSSAIVLVVRKLADAIGVPPPAVYVNPETDHEIEAMHRSTHVLIVGKKINAAPHTPEVRDQLGRALMRLATGGDHVHDNLSQGQLLGLIAALIEAAGVETPELDGVDRDFAETLRPLLPADTVGLAEAATQFVRSIDGFQSQLLRASLRMSEDRAGVVASADPRPTLRHLEQTGHLVADRGRALIGYLLSDDHLSLRRSLGYHPDIDLLDVDIDMEEVS